MHQMQTTTCILPIPRIGNGDKTPWQRDHTFQLGVMPKGVKVAYRRGTGDKESLTQFFWGSTDGVVFPPAYVAKGALALSSLTAGCQYYKDSTFYCKWNTHMMDGQVGAPHFG